MTAGQLELLEESTKHGYAPKERIEEWIEKGWLRENEAGIIFSGYEEVLAQARVLQPTDYAQLLNAFENYWIDKTERDVTGKT